jgi:O-antigen/teichoic acid export membrane protein
MKTFKQKVKMLFQGTFFKNISVLVGATAFAQLITIITIPILTRLYSPEDFNVLAIYSSVIALISVVSCLRLEIAIPIPKEDEDAVALLFLSICSVVGITILTVIGVVLLSTQIEKVTDGQLIGFMWLIPLSVFFAGVYKALQYWATRKKAFSLVAKTRLSQAVSGSGTQLGFGYTGMAPIGLLIGQLVNISGGVIGLSRYFLNNNLSLVRVLNVDKLKSTFKRYDRFPKYSVLESFANTGATQIPVILIAYYAVSAEAGFLMLATRLLSIPISLIGSAVAQVYISEAARKYEKGLLKEFTHKIIITLLKIGAIPIAFVGVIAPFIIPLILGERWERTGIIISWMVPWFLMQFITSPVSMTLHITDHQKLAMILQFVGFLLRVGTVMVGGLYFQEYITEIYSISGFIFYSLYLLIVLIVLKKY